jgi:hypothetical protein
MLYLVLEILLVQPCTEGADTHVERRDYLVFKILLVEPCTEGADTHVEGRDYLVLEILLVEPRTQGGDTHVEGRAAAQVHTVDDAARVEQDAQHVLELPVGRHVDGDLTLLVTPGQWIQLNTNYSFQ